MKLSRSTARETIDHYFTRSKLDVEKTRKMKRLAMRFKIVLGKHRARFCKKCYAGLKSGKIRINKTHKSITCDCGHTTKIKIS